MNDNDNSENDISKTFQTQGKTANYRFRLFREY